MSVRVPVSVVGPWSVQLSMTGVPSTSSRMPSSETVVKRQAPAAKVGVPLHRTEKSLAGRPGAGTPSPQSLSISVSQRVSTGAPASAGLSKYSAVSSPGAHAGVVGVNTAV